MLAMSLVGIAIFTTMAFQDAENKMYYISLISAIIGVWLPSPLLSRDTEPDQPPIQLPIDAEEGE